MAGPFPGMNPYLEQSWRDVHHSLVLYARDALQPLLPPDLRARVDERVYFEFGPGVGRSVYPDVRVYERPVRAGESRGGAAVLAPAEPLIVCREDEPMTEGFVQIIDASSGGRVVTVIEFLSPSNKTPGEGQRLYQKKQQETLAAGVSLVEIDLLRAGERVAVVPEALVPLDYRTPYRVCVSRSWKPLRSEIYALPLRSRLPVIRIPLRETDEDAPLDLQALIDQAYERGGYDDLDYSVDPIPPLSEADAAWARVLVRASQ